MKTTSAKRNIATGIVRIRGWLMAALLVLAAWSVTMIGKTNINYDLNRYLSDETMTKRALQVMEAEFGSSEQLRMMFCDQTEDQMEAIVDVLRKREEVDLASYDPAEDVRSKNNHSWHLVTLTLQECDASALVTDLKSLFPDAGEYYIGGSAASRMDVQQSVANEMPKVMLIAVGIVLLVLLLTSHAWFEPVIILVTLGISIVINMGTNFIFPDVSFITFAVCAILQLALSIDYAIMLLHTYNNNCDGGMTAHEAMTESLYECFMRIASSAATTVAGLLSLLFMSFTIGFDIGLVLSKGIVISMLSVFLFMPGLTLLMQRPLLLTRHRPLQLGGAYLAKGIEKAKKPIAVLLVLAVFFGLYQSSRNKYFFNAADAQNTSASAKINEVFGTSNPLVLLIPGGTDDADYDQQRALAEKLQEIRRENEGNVVAQISAMVTTGAEALKYYTPQDVAELTGLSQGAVNIFFRMQGFGDRVRADHLLEAAGSFTEGNETIAALKEALDRAKQTLEGSHYARMLLEPGFNPGDEDFNTCMETIISTVSAFYGDDFYLTGIPMSNYDISNAFHTDLMKVNLITLLAILLVVTLSFGSLRLPVLLVFVIEGAIWITMGISHLIGEPIFFISYLICLSIQMGATIDYGILLSDQYRTLRSKGQSAPDAMKDALRKALPTVLTSGTILITAGYMIGKQCSVYYISSIGLLVSRGALISTLLVLTLLPALLVLLDRWIMRSP